MNKISFTKMHGCGNDYIYVDAMRYDIPDPSAASIAWSDRHKGIGSDGLVLIGASPVPEADFSMRIFNADGSEAMMCGNASRCIGKYLFERGMTLKKEIRLLTLSGVKTLCLQVADGVVGSVTVDMGKPILEDDTQFIPDSELCEGTFVSMGNPHFVVFTDDVDQVEIKGRMMEHLPAFPQRCNIEFARIEVDDDLSHSVSEAQKERVGEPPVIRTRVWERGSGITQACGTGACATAVAAALTGNAGRHSLIEMDGGSLDIEWREVDNHVYMTGPATFVFDGEINIP